MKIILAPFNFALDIFILCILVVFWLVGEVTDETK